MDSRTGEIRSIEDWDKIFKVTNEEKENLVPFEEGEKENLVPFEEGETLEIKGCLFKVRAIKPAPTNMITLEGIPKEA